MALTSNTELPPKLSSALVDPELVPKILAIGDLVLNEASLPLMRTSAGGPDFPVEPDVRLEEFHIPGPPGGPDVRMLALIPEGLPADSPSLLYIHGGGYVMGNPDGNAGLASKMAKAVGCVVFVPTYRLAPETTWEGSRADLYCALQWVYANAGQFGASGRRLAIAGRSAGGGHAAGLALHARKLGGPPIGYQMLLCPMLDDRQPDNPYLGEYVWTRESDRFGWRALLGMEPGGPDVPEEAVPARAEDLAGLPATFIDVGSIELFAEASLEYARRLMAAGVPVELHVMPGGYHGYESMVPEAGISQFVDLAVVQGLKRAFARME